MTIAEFLEQRLAEDEEAARDVHRSDSWHLDTDWRGDRCDLVGGGKALAIFTDEDPMVPLHIARHDPARVLAEVAAKRAMIWLEDATGEPVMYTALQHLAAVYADHPDYDLSWAVS